MKFPLPIPQPSFSTTLKARLVLIAVCLIAVAGSQVYFKGMDDGVRAVDDDAFGAYTHFAQSMKAEKHHAKAKPAKIARAYAASVWAAVDNH